MELLTKILSAVQDGKITAEELKTILGNQKIDIAMLKKLVNTLGIAALFVPALKPYASAISAAKALLGDGITIDQIMAIIPEKEKSRIMSGERIADLMGMISGFNLAKPKE